MNKKYKYVHILWHDELKFSTTIVNFFNESDTGIDNSQHYFVTPYEAVYNGLKQYDNIEYIPVKNVDSAEIVNIVGKYADWIFLHNSCNRKGIIAIKHKYAKKIIWRYWGARRLQTIPYADKKKFLKNLAIWLMNKLVYKQIHRFRAIGVANFVDITELKKSFGDHNYIRVPYPRKNGLEKLELVRSYPDTNDGIYRIMIGHSGFEEEKHIQFLETLKRFENEKIELYIVLSYGNEEYIKKVKKYVNKNCQNVVIIDKFLPYENFLELIKKMDAAILDAKYSYAIGNIRICLYFKKKLFLNQDGVLAQSFSNENIPFVTTDKLSQMTFDELKKPIHYSEEASCAMIAGQKSVDIWKNIIASLNQI